jgi:hypothetical protein
VRILSAILIALIGLVGVRAAAQTWEKQPTDFRGVPFGASIAEAKTHVKDLSCLRDGTSCRSVFSLADRVQITTFWRFTDDKFVWVGWSFPSRDFDFVRDALVERYGLPSERSEEAVQTRVGTNYTNETLRWNGDRIYISANRYGSTVTESFVQISTHAYQNQMMEQEAAKKKKAATSF